MSLTASMNAARSALFVGSEQTSVVSRNIANSDTALYSRKSANVVTVPMSGARVVSITRATEPSLFRNLLGANSEASAKKALVDALNQLDQTVNDPELDASPAALVSKLADAVQQYAAQPQNELAGQAAVRAAQNVVTALHTATSVVQDVRRDADAGMASAVDRINTLLARFETVNNAIVRGTRIGADVTDYQDARDQILADLSSEVGIRTVTRPGDDMAIFTDSGLTMFDRTARAVTFDRSLNLAPGISGNAVFIDGVAVTGPGATMPIQSGQIKGLAEVRDVATVVYQRQLDETARVLVQVFAESDQSAAPSLPDVPGLFTYPGAPAMPPSGIVVDGMAGMISVNANVDPTRGGLVTRLRDGGISDPLEPAYVYNTEGGASFSGRLNQLYNMLNEEQSFDALSGVDNTATLSDFAASSAAWLQEQRRTADGEYEYRSTLYQRSAESYSKLTGVNLDEEMTMLLELERSYQSTAKLISVIDSMYSALVQAIR